MRRDQYVFPGVACVDGKSEGMTLRDYFAIHATDEDIVSFMDENPKIAEKSITFCRYAYADAMIKERSK